jgi:hypothetical protein
MNPTQALIFETTDAVPSRMGGATGSAELVPSRPSLLDRLIEERRRGDCSEPRRAPRPAAPAEAVAAPAVAGPAEAVAAPAVAGPAEAVAVPAEAVAAPSPATPSPRVPVAGGESSLADLVSATWESLAVAETASCFVCGGDLLPRFGAGARPVGGRCRDCGSELS